MGNIVLPDDLMLMEVDVEAKKKIILSSCAMSGFKRKDNPRYTKVDAPEAFGVMGNRFIRTELKGESLVEEYGCLICMEKTSAFITSCDHMIGCGDCYTKFFDSTKKKNQDFRCPYCRRLVYYVQKVHYIR